MICHILRSAFLSCLLTAAAAAGAPPVVTSLEGDATLTRGTARYILAEGVKLQQTDIVEVSDKGMLQIEFDDGLILALGPGGRALLVSLSGKSGLEVFVLDGWAKAVTAATTLRLTTPTANLRLINDVAVLRREVGLLSVFDEQGDMKLTESAAGKGAERLVYIRSGEFYTRKEFERGEIAPRPGKVFVAELPRPFRDNLSSRAARFSGRAVEPRKTGEITYSEAEAWLTSTQGVRHILVPRWRVRASDTGFRKGLIGNLTAHPEWDRILFPERYLPKEPLKEPAKERHREFAPEQPLKPKTY